MTLTDLCEPLFLHLCRLSRRHRAGDAPVARAIRDELATILTDLRARAALSPALFSQFERIEPALILCIDNIMRTSDWPCAKGWTPPTARAALPSNDDAARFFELLRNTLDDPSQPADERLEVLASCAALSFATTDLPQADRAALDQLRLRLALDAARPICTDVQSHTDPTDLTRPTPRPAIALVAIGLTAIAAANATDSLRALGSLLIRTFHQAPAQASGAATAESRP